MDVLRNCILKLFKSVSITDLLGQFVNDQQFSNTTNFSRFQDYWERGFTQDKSKLSMDELKAIWDYLATNCMVSNDGLPTIHGVYLFKHISESILKEHQYEPLCRFSNLLRWQNISLFMGEDIFTTAFLAGKDSISGRERDYFTWSAILRTDNFRLRQLLQKGIAENHFHLKGSANHVFLNWIAALNNPLEARKRIDKRIKSKESGNAEQKLLLKIKTNIYVAAKIRYLIFNDSHNKWENQVSTTYKVLKLLDDKLEVNDLSRDINASARLYAYSYHDKKGDRCYLDYAIEKNVSEQDRNDFLIYRGERKLLYDWQRRINSQSSPESEKLRLADLLYIYQVIYFQFRSLFVQNDGTKGFASFSTYDKRKELFIENTHYEVVRDFLAIAGSRLHQNITHFETRITPKDKSRKMKSAISNIQSNSNLKYYDYDPINRYLNLIADKRNVYEKGSVEKENEHFYVVHFIKEHEKKINELSSCIQPRHYILRKKIKQHTLALAELRAGNSDAKTKILGIDAANTEFGARPEVFAQSYRYLSKHLPKRSHLDVSQEFAPQLRLTFHAGEDFYDIVDGLRTIDEAIEFCRLSRGDRIGHALAMGIDAESYYKSRFKEVYIPKQLLMDNIVWMLEKCKVFSIEINHQFEKQYTEKYRELFRCIFESEHIPDMLTYCKSYKLRCDDPLMYLTNEYRLSKHNAINFWQRCALDDRKELQEIRKDDEAVNLLREYHFNYQARRNGVKTERFEVDQEYKRVVSLLQRKMQDKVNSIGIGIEANPTSNRLISKFGLYCEHPIIKWYNLGLTYDKEALDSCPQMFVSINTDDQGVFNTCLENEYALLVLALQKDLNSDGSRKYTDAYIYDWVDRIRNNGIEQSFLQHEGN